MKNRIKEFRARNDLARAARAKQVQIRRETIVFLEKDKYNPLLKLVHDIASCFGVPVEEIFIFN